MNIAALLHNAAMTFGSRPAQAVGTDIRQDYAGLQMRVARLAAGLRGKLGLATGARVALVMGNGPAYLEALFAIWHAGLAAVPVNAKLHAREVAYILADCGAELCFLSDDLAGATVREAEALGCKARWICVDRPEYEALLQDPQPAIDRGRDDIAWLFYTSGTTGKPKGAMLSHQNLQLMSWSYLCDFDQLTERDSILHLGPQSHAAGLLALAHVARGSMHVLPESGIFDPDEIAALIDANESLTFFAAPTMLRRLVESPRVAASNLSHVRSILGGAAPFYAEDIRRGLDLFGMRFTNGYGQGECPCTITAMPKRFYTPDIDADRLASVGIARTGVEVRVVDANGAELPPGECGEIIVRSDIVMRGYWNNETATKQALAGGWLHTGDIGRMDSGGFLWLLDRSKDLIISGGSNIYPREVEDVLLGASGVLEVAVVGEPDPEWGENVIAFVVVRGGYAPEVAALDALCLENLARFKRPKRYVFVDALPRNSTGKVLKTTLRTMLA